MPPKELWQLTPRELALCLRALQPQRLAPPGRSALRDLLTRFPDQ